MGETIFWRLIEREPDRVAVHFLRGHGRAAFQDEPLTVGDWRQGAGASAAALVAHGIGRGDRVLLCLPTGRAFLERFVGALWIGAVPIPLPSLEGFARPAALVERLASVVRDAAPSAVFADRRTAAHLRIAGLVGGDLPLIDPPPDAPAPEPRPAVDGETAFIQYTSGSTGTPRGVVVTAANLAANIAAMGRALLLSPADRVVSWLPLYHDMGLIGGLLAPAAHRAAVWLLSPLEFMFRPASWLRACSEARATLTVAPNFAYGIAARKLSDAELTRLDLSCLRAAINGAEPIDAATARAFCGRMEPYGFKASSFFPVYGLAESTLSVTFPPLGRGVKIDRVGREELASGWAAPAGAREPSVEIVGVGRALEGHEVRIAGADDHQPLPDRKLGEILVQGGSVSPWYFDRQVPRPERRTWLRTGDLGYIAEGELYVVDRLKDLVIVAGRCHAPSDIERAANTVPGIRAGRSVAFGVNDAQLGTESLVIVAEVKPRAIAELRALAEAVRAAVLEQIGLAPADVRLVRPGTLARTSSGKLMRRHARDQYVSGELDRALSVRPVLPPRFARALRRGLSRLLASYRPSQS